MDSAAYDAQTSGISASDCATASAVGICDSAADVPARERQLAAAHAAVVLTAQAPYANLNAGKRVLVLGLTFKENVPDLRNSRVIDVVQGLSKRGYSVDLHDPLADPAEATAFYGLDLMTALDDAAGYHGVVGAVAHTEYTNLSAVDLAGLLSDDGLLADIKGIWRGLALPAGIQRWEL